MPRFKRRSRHAYSPAHFAIAASVSKSRQYLRSRFFGLNGLLSALVSLDSFIGGFLGSTACATGGAGGGAAGDGVALVLLEGVFSCTGTVAVAGATAGDVAAGGVGAAAATFVCVGAVAALGAFTAGFATGFGTCGIAAVAATGFCFKPSRSRSMGSKYANATPAAMTKAMSNNFLLSMLFLSRANPQYSTKLQTRRHQSFRFRRSLFIQ